jgi:hypothetical protein
MGFKSLDPDARTSVLVCDACDTVLARNGTNTKKTFAESDPSDLAQHYENESVLHQFAISRDWTHAGERWSCPSCVKKVTK